MKTPRIAEDNGASILLVEDNDDDVLITSLALRQSQLPYSLRTVENGAVALKYLKGEDGFEDRVKYPIPRLVLLDLNTPKLSGFKVLEWIRKQPSMKNILVVVFSGSNAETDLKEANNNGANSYLVKPAKFDDWVNLLGTTVRYWMSMHQSKGTSKSPRKRIKSVRH